jgi:NAD(P)-dependent dehydrogenase (short-subunit alcohol dehydrogenase family)
MSPEGNGEGIRGRTVLVTGGGHGLGAALVRAAAQEGARVVVNCRKNLKGAEALARDLRKTGTEVFVRRADVTDHVQARELVEGALAAFGRIDVLLNTVGGFSWKPLAETEPEEWRAVMASNLDSVYHMCRLVVPGMRKHHWGRIVNLGAVGAERTLGQPQVAAYSAAKSAVIAFSKALALEEARCGITVNVVSPGVLEDDAGDERVLSDRPRRPVEHANGGLGDRVPVGRPGAVDDVVRAVLFFASPAADFVTGQVLSVAGGWRL